jgi:hypothetical protein
VRLVLVEGFPGSGKSTTAQWLALECARQGWACRWIYEQQPDHPVSRPAPPKGWGPTWEDWSEERLGHWNAFVAAPGPLTIMESALLQHPLLSMLRRDAGRDFATRHVQRLAAAVRPLEPRLVYLKVADGEATYRALTVRRGDASFQAVLRGFEGLDFAERTGLRGLDLLLAYWRFHHDVMESALPALGLPTLVVDQRAGTWPAWRGQIAAFLGLAPPGPPPAPPVDLARYVGRYQVRWRDRDVECTVRLAGDGLVLDGLLWPDNRLLWKSGDVFRAEAWPYEIVFPATGAAGRFLTVNLDV